MCRDAWLLEDDRAAAAENAAFDQRVDIGAGQRGGDGGRGLARHRPHRRAVQPGPGLGDLPAQGCRRHRVTHRAPAVEDHRRAVEPPLDPAIIARLPHGRARGGDVGGGQAQAAAQGLQRLGNRNIDGGARGGELEAGAIGGAATQPTERQRSPDADLAVGTGEREGAGDRLCVATGDLRGGGAQRGAAVEALRQIAAAGNVDRHRPGRRLQLDPHIR